MKGLIALSKKEAHRVEVMEQVVLGRIGLKMASQLRSRILSLHEDRYSGLNDSHFTELLAQHEGIGVSRESVRHILRSAGKGPKRRRRPGKVHLLVNSLPFW